jgi:ADP-ribose pyrophosphatase
MYSQFSRVFLTDEQGAWLILKDRKDQWNLPGGKQEAGETALACAIREVKEETALDVEKLETLYQGELTFGDTTWQATFYFAHQAQGKPTMNESGKITGIQFADNLNLFPYASELQPVFDLLEQQQLLVNKTTHWIR